MNSGGIETVTGVLCQEFLTLNIKSYCIWQLIGGKDNDRYPFCESRSINDCSISGILEEWNIDVVIVQAYNEIVPMLRRAINQASHPIKLIYVLHSKPGWELATLEWHNIAKMARTQGLRGWIKLLLYPLFYIYYKCKIKKMYSVNHAACDRIVLLSNNFIDDYTKLISIKDSSKIRFIPNACRYINKSWTKQLYAKKKKVLIVSRLSEYDKRISLALNIWKHIENDNRFDDWDLTIVGDGSDLNLYKGIIKKNNLNRAHILGRQVPDYYYKESSIFMMTSKFEGFGLTLVEAQSFGCVPIAFNTFASLSQIIEHNVNGIIVNEGNLSSFVKWLKLLMIDQQLLNQLRISALNNVQKFSIESIGHKWQLLFND